MPDKLFLIGKIITPHGVRGEVRVKILTDFPDRFKTLKHVWLEDNTKLVVDNVKMHQDCALIKFNDFSSRDMTATLCGKNIMVKEDELVELPAGHYFIFDLIGLDVFQQTGEYLGQITDVLQTGSNDVYVVDNSGHQLLIPAIKQVVLAISLQEKRMTVKLQEEWE